MAIAIGREIGIGIATDVTAIVIVIDGIRGGVAGLEAPAVSEIGTVTGIGTTAAPAANGACQPDVTAIVTMAVAGTTAGDGAGAAARCLD